MLWALGQPIAFLGLLCAFLTGLFVRRTVHYFAGARQNHEPWLNLRRDIDPFGAVAAAVGGAGWGRAADVVTRSRLWVLLLGAGFPFFLGLAVLFSYARSSFSSFPLQLYTALDILRGVPGEVGEQFFLAYAVGLLTFGLLALFPVPPLDGWGILVWGVRRPGAGFAKVQYWLAEQNVGVAILLAASLLPLVGGVPPLLFLIDVLLTPFLRVFG